MSWIVGIIAYDRPARSLVLMVAGDLVMVLLFTLYLVGVRRQRATA